MSRSMSPSLAENISRFAIIFYAISTGAFAEEFL